MVNECLIVVVIYEINLEDSITFQRLLLFQAAQPNFPQILVYDNSVTAKFSDKFLENIFLYKHDPANSGVAGAYNYAMDIVKSHQKKWLVLFDQDTNIRNNFFERLYASIQTYPGEKLFCPVVRSAGNIVSPTYFIAQKPIKPASLTAGLINSRFFTVINSGLAVAVSELAALGGYDSALPLDYSDHYFFSRYKKQNKQFVLIDCENLHNLSSDSDIHFHPVFSRFKMYCKSGFIYSKKINNFLPLVWVMFRAMKLTFKFRRMDFIKFFFSQKVIKSSTAL